MYVCVYIYILTHMFQQLFLRGFIVPRYSAKPHNTIVIKTDQVVWISHLFQNFQQFIVIHTVKDLGIVNKAEIDVFLELSSFFHDPADVGNLVSEEK